MICSKVRFFSCFVSPIPHLTVCSIEFYASLGTPRLSSLVEECCKTSKEIKDCSNAKEIRSIVLQRLPLFVHGRKHSWTFDISQWLSDENGFVVKTYKAMEVTKVLQCRPPLSRLQNTSAVARRGNGRSIELVLARTKHSPTDMYEWVTLQNIHQAFVYPPIALLLLFWAFSSSPQRSMISFYLQPSSQRTRQPSREGVIMVSNLTFKSWITLLSSLACSQTNS